MSTIRIKEQASAPSTPPSGDLRIFADQSTKQLASVDDAGSVVFYGGDVVGPAGATDEAMARFDLATGKLLQDSLVKANNAGDITTPGTVQGRNMSADGTKLDGIEPLAQVDQSDAEIKTQYENNADTNEFSDAEEAKLVGIEALAEVNNISDVNATDLTDGGATTLHTHAGISNARENFYMADYGGNLGDMRTRSVGSNASFQFNFVVPLDFATLTSIELVFVPAGTFAAQNIDLTSDYGAIGEQSINHSESDVANTVSGTAGQVSVMDISSVFSLLAAGDYAGVTANHQAIGTSIDYLGIRLRYTV